MLILHYPRLPGPGNNGTGSTIFKGVGGDTDTFDYFEQEKELRKFQKHIDDNAKKYNYDSLDLFTHSKDILDMHMPVWLDVSNEKNSENNKESKLNPDLLSKIKACIKDKKDCLGFNVPFQCYMGGKEKFDKNIDADERGFVKERTDDQEKFYRQKMWEIFIHEPVWNDFKNGNWEDKKKLINTNFNLINEYIKRPTRCKNKEE